MLNSSQLQPSPILVYGHHALRTVAKLVPDNYPLPVLKAHVKDLWASLAATGADGGALAATQIGLGLRICLIRSNQSGFPPNAVDAMGNNSPIDCGGQGYGVFINPYLDNIDLASLREGSVEGCLSIPGYQDANRTLRYSSFTLKFQQFNCVSGEIEHVSVIVNDGNPSMQGFTWIIQHEIGHMDGIFFTDLFYPNSPSNPSRLMSIQNAVYSTPHSTLPQQKY